ncbi:TnsA endonuclease N-terminal domain-containing protein [Paraburkholderia sp. SARCC-3016]|uniref:TnsA endonuclease N-terminal domain-containing protein n=1 Tax=Paraburkholderia sp. SARCC-3016 TaxID=3058611 RepID=UPI0028071DF6|nr:TnsA endonuclease N-terminal domain-containing protein [Paraburkholderia sp. SARCC-3016]MDQ7978041.1 TnsA endonuclease N-terminal domain-containing protein [Paraburkholderia sp. SARCC-3016]
MASVRKVVTRSPHRRVGLIACSWFQSTPIEYESLLERDFVRLALLDPEVTSIVHQPFFIDLGALGRYVPDFMLTGPEQRLVVEVKPEEHSVSVRNKPRLQRASEMLREKGFDFMLATEKWIKADGRHERAAILLRHARSHLAPELTTRVLALAARSPDGIALGTLASTAGVPASAVLHLLGRRFLRTNAALSFSDSQRVYPFGRQS